MRGFVIILAGIVVAGVLASGCIPIKTDTSVGCFDSQVVQETNAARVANGLPAFKENADLDTAAQNHSNWMATTQTFTHDNWVAEINSTGYQYTTAGQNIEEGSSAADVVNVWMNSPEHRANILNPNFHDLGVGCAESNGTLYWTQDFGG